MTSRLLERIARARIDDVVRSSLSAGQCPACFGAGIRVTLQGLSQVCECQAYPAALAVEWGLPVYLPDDYVTEEEEVDP